MPKGKKKKDGKGGKKKKDTAKDDGKGESEKKDFGPPAPPDKELALKQEWAGSWSMCQWSQLHLSFRLNELDIEMDALKRQVDDLYPLIVYMYITFVHWNVFLSRHAVLFLPLTKRT